MNPDVLEVVANGAASACGGCGAALAADQHYCLHCGAPQGAPRVPYRELIAPALAASHTATPAGPPPVPPAMGGVPVASLPLGPSRDWTAVIALGGLATLALVLVVGVLIGKSGSNAQPAAVAPQVITVSAPAAAATPAAQAPVTTTGGNAGGSSKGAKGGGGKAKQTPKALKDLQSTSGSDYQKKSSKLPTTVKIPGKPPAKDNKAAGGGSGAETIG